jgi:serine/threonine protein kinase
VDDKRYKIGQELGSGSFSTIYEAFDMKKNMKVAIKMEKPDKAKRILIQEYQFLKKLTGVQGVL